MNAPLRMIRAAPGHHDPFRRTPILISRHDTPAADATRLQHMVEIAMPDRRLVRRGAGSSLDARRPGPAIAYHPERGAFGRFVGAGVNFLIGAGVHSYGSVGMPVAATAIAFVLGVFLLPLCLETRGEQLPG